MVPTTTTIGARPMTTLTTDQAADAAAYYSDIARQVRVLKYLKTRQDSNWRENLILHINEDALSVRVRDDWYTPGMDGENVPLDYEILLTWGGPALRIVGKLDHYGQPESAVLEFQDWGIPWTPVHENGPLVDYARCWHFAEC
jgi:hypothetical protein